MSAAEADRWAWLLVLSFVFGCNVLRILLPSFSFFMSRVLQKDAEQESQMRAEIQGMKQELSTVNMMDEFARYARLERRINKMTDKLKTHVKARTAQLAKIKWVVSVAFYILQGVSAGRPDGLAHLEVLLCPCGCGAKQVDNSPGPPGSVSYEGRRWCWNYLLDFSL
ncbi:guided entry of tail-anchored proteins factor 1 isoform X3 [Cervus elaphus]|uniref:guided entry of tail-anchored proteins factor 1 isoform X3 n=1 Tax=Cervus canadensis TaxID=1574408 RepID=UPI001C9E9DDA|nr:guided entry of tail-anchored proteins factor 1 isoform X3 [Cervus canadensis]XP_043730324.1 guided entry of tail-anchored proteins factor 1 isoform X3 [Cervus elaphus]